jgi:hypothetical protein
MPQNPACSKYVVLFQKFSSDFAEGKLKITIQNVAADFEVVAMALVVNVVLFRGLEPSDFR